MEIVSRRKFFQKSVFVVGGSRMIFAAAAAGTSFLLGGCDVLAAIENWVPVGLDAFENLLALLESNGIVVSAVGQPLTAIAETVRAAFAQVVADIKAYQALNPRPAAIPDKIVAGLQIVVSNFQAFLSSINVSDSRLLALVTGLASLIINTIAGFEGQLVNAPVSSMVKARTYKVSTAKHVAVVPEKHSVRSFKKTWNHQLQAAGQPNFKLRESFFEKL